MPKAKTLATRDARAKLRPDHEPYWTPIKRGLAIGYRKGPTGGGWYVRRYADGGYKKKHLSTADDTAPADGERVLSWAQVLKKSLGDEVQATLAVTRLTVAELLALYLDHRKAKSRSEYSVSVDEGRIRNHVIPKFGDAQVADLTSEDLARWRDALVAEALGTRTNEDTESARREAQRRAQATADRTWRIFRAMLAYGYSTGRVQLADAWRRIKPYAGVDKPRDRFLSVEECRRLLNACAPDFRELVRGAMLTGLRLGELTRLTVADYAEQVLIVPSGKPGKSRRLPLTSEGCEFFDEVTTGRPGAQLVFTRADGEPWGQGEQTRRMEAACTAAKISPRISFHGLRHTYGSLLVNQGASLLVISKALGHADTRMTQRVYAHLEENVMRKALEKALPRIGDRLASNVKRIDRAKRVRS